MKRAGGAPAVSEPRPRQVLHVDLDPFFLNVEISLDPSLRGRPVVVGGAAQGMVAAASAEARAKGVRPGQIVAQARRLCPDGVFLAGNLDTYARISEQVTATLLAASRRVERPSADEAYLDLNPNGQIRPVAAAEAIKDELQRRLGLDAALGLASSRVAARVASSWARPRGLLIVLPGYERSFLARQSISFLPDLPSHIEAALEKAGIATLGDVIEAGDEALAAAVGPVTAARLREAAQGLGESPITPAAPPTWIQEETAIRDSHSDQQSLADVVAGLAARASRRLRPFGLLAGALSVEVRSPGSTRKREEELAVGVCQEEDLAELARSWLGPLIENCERVNGLAVKLRRLAPPSTQRSLFS